MLPSGMMRGARVTYDVPKSLPGWELREETMPESVPHDSAVDVLRNVLGWWAQAQGNVQIARNLALRWDATQPRVGIDPDVCVLAPPPPDGENLKSLRTWLPGHAPPKLAIEVVSETNAAKDYAESPDKYAVSGTEELWIFDPELAGPRIHGGPLRLQVWRRTEGAFVREYAGEGPAWSAFLGAWAVVTEDGAKLRVAAGAAGSGPWLTEAEAERAAKEAERAAKEAALARVQELEALLAERSRR
jgi:Uma2 family endonuclease